MEKRILGLEHEDFEMVQRSKLIVTRERVIWRPARTLHHAGKNLQGIDCAAELKEVGDAIEQLVNES